MQELSLLRILPESGLLVGESLAIAAGILLFSALVVCLKKRKLGKISPVRTIAGGQEEIYFDSRLQAPIAKRALSLTLSFRQLTSGMKRYVGTVFIAAILMFFMLTAELIGNCMSSESALNALVAQVSEISITWKDSGRQGEKTEEIDALVASISGIKAHYHGHGGYMSMNGENLRALCYQYPECIQNIQKGRAPLYDNEVVITEMVADTLGVEIGDEVTVANQDREAHCLISGIYQSTQDVGMVFALSMEGANRLGIEEIAYMDFALEEPAKREGIANVLKDQSW